MIERGAVGATFIELYRVQDVHKYNAISIDQSGISIDQSGVSMHMCV